VREAKGGSSPLIRMAVTRPARLEHVLESHQVGFHRRRVSLEVVVTDSRLVAEREHDLAAIAVADNTHRVVEGLAGRQRHAMVEHPELVTRDERKTNPSHRRRGEPFVTHALDGVAETGSPLR